MIRAFRGLIISASLGHNEMVLQIYEVGRDCEDQDGPRVLSTFVREGRLGRSRFEEHGTRMVFMNVVHWKGRRWDEDWCALTECPSDGAEFGEWKEMYDILSAVSRVPRKGRRNWKISGRQSCGIGQQESRGRAPLRRCSEANAGGKSADSHKRGANGKSRRGSVDKVSSALCGSPREDKMEFEGVGALVLAGQALWWPSRQLGVVFLVTQMVQCKSICSRFGVRIRLWQEHVPFTEEWHSSV